ncbi:MAG: DNA-directed RNA polymerase [Thermoproteus sp.]|jgi:DNA-directed RNA polymerase subunit M
MRFCPRDGTLMVPVKKDGQTVLKCPKCGYEVRLTERDKRAYSVKTAVSEDKKRGVMTASESSAEVDQEELEELRKQLLENLQEGEEAED